jgi:hypothetical protein
MCCFEAQTLFSETKHTKERFSLFAICETVGSGNIFIMYPYSVMQTD